MLQVTYQTGLVVSRQKKCLMKLLEYKADINIRNNEGLTTVKYYRMTMVSLRFDIWLP